MPAMPVKRQKSLPSPSIFRLRINHLVILNPDAFRILTILDR